MGARRSRRLVQVALASALVSGFLVLLPGVAGADATGSFSGGVLTITVVNPGDVYYFSTSKFGPATITAELIGGADADTFITLKTTTRSR